MSQTPSNQRSVVDLRKLDRPDTRPLLDPSWTPAETDETTPLPRIYFESSWTNANAPAIRRSDIEDLRRIWLTTRKYYGYTSKPRLLRGHWKIGSGQQIDNRVTPLIQYRSLAVCFKGGLGTVVIKPADINNILDFCLQKSQGGQMPHCKGSLEYNAQGLRLQWLLLPVESVSAGLRVQVQNLETLLDQARQEGCKVTQTQILAEFERRMRLGLSLRFSKLLYEHRINWKKVLSDPTFNKDLPEGYEVLLDRELETLFDLPRAGSTRSCPLPLRID